MTELRLDVVSDVVCPWCWLGKRRLDLALADVDDLDVTVAFRPFQLDPEVPAGGVDYADYMKAKFGDLSRIKDAQTRLTEMGRAIGIDYRFDEIATRPNTADAHRVIRWAHGQDKGLDAVESLFRAHFDELRDIGDRAVLAEIAGEIGMDRTLVAELLAAGRDAEESAAEEAFFRGLGVNAVPTFIGNGRTAIQGAHEVEAMTRFMRAASAVKDVRRA
jgi:predicted DsbA family dithiol-disulfide isomerase